MKIFLLASGKCKRWQAFKPVGKPDNKCLTEICGRPLIQWTINQLEDRNLDYTVTASNVRDYIQFTDNIVCTAKFPNMLHVIEHVWMTSDSFTVPVIVLLGDTLYSDAALNMILATERDGITFYGRHYETFAMVIWKQFIPFLREVIKNKGSKLRDLRYFLRHGERYRPEYLKNELADRAADHNFITISDWTNDLDHYKSYNKIIKNVDCDELKRR